MGSFPDGRVHESYGRFSGGDVLCELPIDYQITMSSKHLKRLQSQNDQPNEPDFSDEAEASEEELPITKGRKKASNLFAMVCAQFQRSTSHLTGWGGL